MTSAGTLRWREGGRWPREPSRRVALEVEVGRKQWEEWPLSAARSRSAGTVERGRSGSPQSNVETLSNSDLGFRMYLVQIFMILHVYFCVWEVSGVVGKSQRAPPSLKSTSLWS